MGRLVFPNGIPSRKVMVFLHGIPRRAMVLLCEAQGIPIRKTQWDSYPEGHGFSNGTPVREGHRFPCGSHVRRAMVFSMGFVAGRPWFSEWNSYPKGHRGFSAEILSGGTWSSQRDAYPEEHHRQSCNIVVSWKTNFSCLPSINNHTMKYKSTPRASHRTS